MENNFTKDLGVRKKSNGLLISTIALAATTVIGFSFGTFELITKNQLKAENSTLKNDIEALKSATDGIEKRVLKGNATKKTVEIEAKGLATEADGTVSTIDSKKYLEPKDWNIKFAYPDGVTDIAYGVSSDNFDGALYITGIAKNGRVYDVNICGGQAAYEQYPFFLGEVDRWNPSGEHEEWQTSPSVYEGMKKLLKNGSYEYYVNTYYGNGCETGENNPDYIEALKLAKEILESAEKK